MTRLRLAISSALAATALSFAVACTEPRPTEVPAPAPPPATPGARSLLAPSLLYCPSTTTQSTTQLVDVTGGTVSLLGTSVVIPTGALLGPTNITVTLPAGDFMEVDIYANGGSYLFSQPITVNLGYARCSGTLLKLLSTWNIDETSKALLAPMTGLDDKLTQTYTFTTSHLSGYAIAD